MPHSVEALEAVLRWPSAGGLARDTQWAGGRPSLWPRTGNRVCVGERERERERESILIVRAVSMRAGGEWRRRCTFWKRCRRRASGPIACRSTRLLPSVPSRPRSGAPSGSPRSVLFLCFSSAFPLPRLSLFLPLFLCLSLSLSHSLTHTR